MGGKRSFPQEGAWEGNIFRASETGRRAEDLETGSTLNFTLATVRSFVCFLTNTNNEHAMLNWLHQFRHQPFKPESKAIALNHNLEAVVY